MKSFYRAHEPEIIYATLSRKSMGTEVLSEKYATLSRISGDQVRKKKSETASCIFHRGLHCLVLIDLKLGKFTHADAGQMHLYLNYAREHWTRPEENPPVGLILCAYKDKAVAKYSLEGLPNKVLAAEYKTALPDERVLAEDLVRTRRALDAREEAEKDCKLS